MVMRGLPVPAEKRKYISLDAAREAFVQGVPFGRLNDPLGKPTERGLALIPFAQMHELAEDYVMSFMQGVWSEGLDAGTDAHLKIIVERCGLHWQAAKDILKSQSNEQHWRAVAEQNREALFALDKGEPNPFPSLNRAALVRNVDYWRQNRDLTLLLLLGIYALNLVDANVDAHLSGFDISEDLTLKVAPQIGTLSASTSMGFSLTFQFK